MKKLLYFRSAACAIALVTALLAAGCAKSDTTPATTPSSPQTEQPSTPPSSSPTEESSASQPSAGESLDDVLSLSAGIGSVKYDMIISSPGMDTVTTKVWLKDNKMKMETSAGGEDIINIIDHDAQQMYMYMPSQNMAFLVTYDASQASPIDETQSISQYNPTSTGVETIDGKVCLIVEYNVNGASTKAWIWQEHGFPIKVVATTTQGTTTIEYKNIEFIDISDSEFQLPAGVQIMDIPTQS